MAAVKAGKKEIQHRINKDQHRRTLFIKESRGKIIPIKQKPDGCKQKCHTGNVGEYFQKQYEFVFSSLILHKNPQKCP